MFGTSSSDLVRVVGSVISAPLPSTRRIASAVGPARAIATAPAAVAA